MPRAPSSRPATVSSNVTSTSANAAALKRNQACHQCRKRKLKCDAQLPCAACVRSHQFALKSHPSTAGLVPDCTYDDPVEVLEGPKAKLQKLENKIAQLEAQLRAKDSQPTPPGSSTSPPTRTDDSVYGLSSSELGISPTDFTSTSPIDLFGTAQLPHSPHIISPGVLNGQSDIPLQGEIPLGTHQARGSFEIPIFPESGFSWQDLTFDDATTNNLYDFNGPSTATNVGSTMLPSPDPSPPLIGLALMDPSWPQNIPPRELLNHLIDTFFANVPHANRVIHRPRFMASLQNHPTSYQFPHVALLHAICAISSLYTPVVTSTPLMKGPPGRVGPISVFNSGILSNPKQPPTSGPCHQVLREAIMREETGFGMAHARWCAQSFYSSIQTGDRLSQLLQATLILLWYYYSLGRTVDVWVYVGSAVRLVLPLGFNSSEGFTPLSRLDPSQLSVKYHPKSKSDIELARNLFWLTYTTEKLYTAGSVWPPNLDDEDISQLMPIKLTDFLSENDVPAESRQRLATHKMLLIHPPETTDSFSFYIKSAVLLGKVKTFNVRFKTKYASPMSNAGPGAWVDPRETAEFQLLDTLITSFKNSFPKEYREPVSVDGKVDPILYQALLLPHVSMILLHDPHAELSSQTCMSADRMMTACHAILDLIYKICATSFDLMRLDHASSFCWFVCGAALIRFIKYRVGAGDEPAVIKLKSEYDIVRFMLGHLGERTLVGLRQIKLLDDMFQTEIGALDTAFVREAQMSEIIDSLSV